MISLAASLNIASLLEWWRIHPLIFYWALIVRPRLPVTWPKFLNAHHRTAVGFASLQSLQRQGRQALPSPRPAHQGILVAHILGDASQPLAAPRHLIPYYFLLKWQSSHGRGIQQGTDKDWPTPLLFSDKVKTELSVISHCCCSSRVLEEPVSQRFS